MSEAGRAIPFTDVERRYHGNWAYMVLTDGEQSVSPYTPTQQAKAFCRYEATVRQVEAERDELRRHLKALSDVPDAVAAMP